MTPPIIIEGTAEELVTFLQGQSTQRFRLTELVPHDDDQDTDSADDAAEPTLAERFEGRIGRFHFGDAHLSQDTGKKFAALINKKREKGRL